MAVRDVKWATVDIATSGVNQVVAAVSDRSLRVVSLTLVCANQVGVTIEDGDGTVLVPQMSFAQYGGLDVSRGIYGGTYLCQTGKGKSLVFRLSSAVQVSGSLNYVEV